jgi:hypothetical protein
MIFRTAFGLNIGVQNESANRLQRAVREFFTAKVNKYVYLAVVCFPELNYLIRPIRNLIDTIYIINGWSPSGVIAQITQRIINSRKTIEIKSNDILQVLLDTRADSEVVSKISYENLTATNGKTDEIYYNGFKSKTFKTNQIRLNENQINTNVCMLFIAALETTSSALAYAVHYLVNYPDLQEKVREEVRELLQRDGKLDFNVVTELKYMEAFLNESLRLYPPLITASTHQCLNDYKYKDIVIPKGAAVVVATYHLQHDPDYWPEPEYFDPMRFSAERKHELNPLSWQPFGAGPRNCIGMRFAYLEMKLTLAKLLLNYRLESVAETEIRCVATKCTLISLRPKNGVIVGAVKL